jgi:hypothetical protein
MSNLELSTNHGVASPDRSADRFPDRGGRYIGPPLLAPALAHVVLFVASIVVGTSAGVFGRPDIAAAVLTANLAEHAGAARTVAFLQVGSGVALGVFTAAVAAAVRSRTPRLAGLDIARFGGYGAGLLLAVSGLATWSAAEAAARDGGPAAVKALTLVSFATGGPGYVALFGLLVAGIAVPLFIARLVPRWIGATGIALAVVAELALLSLTTDVLQPLLPVARFPGTLWLLIVAAVLVPRRRLASR